MRICQVCGKKRLKWSGWSGWCVICYQRYGEIAKPAPPWYPGNPTFGEAVKEVERLKAEAAERPRTVAASQWLTEPETAPWVEAVKETTRWQAEQAEERWRQANETPSITPEQLKQAVYAAEQAVQTRYEEIMRVRERAADRLGVPLTAPPVQAGKSKRRLLI
jgi:hypothetical protein